MMKVENSPGKQIISNFYFDFMEFFNLDYALFDSADDYIATYRKINYFRNEEQFYNGLLNLSQKKLKRFETFYIRKQHLKRIMPGAIFIISSLLIFYFILYFNISQLSNLIKVLLYIIISLTIPSCVGILLFYPRKKNIYQDIYSISSEKLGKKEKSIAELIEEIFDGEFTPKLQKQVHYSSLLALFIKSGLFPDKKLSISHLLIKLYELEFEAETLRNDINTKSNHVSIKAQSELINILGFKKESIEKALRTNKENE